MKKGGGELWVISDIHFDRYWDKLQNFFNDRRILSYLNPNNEMRKVVRMANQDDKALAMIINGDSVDHYFADYLRFWEFFRKDRNKGRPNNFNFFYSVLKRLTIPFYQVPGNHDYRKEAYNYRQWDRLLDVNISDKIREKYAEKIGRHKSRLFFEVNDIFVDESELAPLGDFKGFKEGAFRKIGGYDCLFFNTGSDAFVRPRNWLRYFWQVVLRGRLGLHSDGLFKKDFDLIKKYLNRDLDKTLYLFMHAPVVNTWDAKFGTFFDLDKGNLFKSMVKSNIADEVIFNGLEELFFLLVGSKRNIVVISSHTHLPRYFLINKKKLRVKCVSLDELNKKRNEAGYVKQITTASLGSIPWKTRDKRTGFLKITPAGFEEIILHNFKYLGV